MYRRVRGLFMRFVSSHVVGMKHCSASPDMVSPVHKPLGCGLPHLGTGSVRTLLKDLVLDDAMDEIGTKSLTSKTRTSSHTHTHTYIAPTCFADLW